MTWRPIALRRGEPSGRAVGGKLGKACRAVPHRPKGRHFNYGAPGPPIMQGPARPREPSTSYTNTPPR